MIKKYPLPHAAGQTLHAPELLHFFVVRPVGVLYAFTGHVAELRLLPQRELEGAVSRQQA